MSSSNRLEDAEWLTLTAGDEIEWTGRPSLITVAPQLLAAFVVGFGGALAVSALDSVLQTGVPASLRVFPILAGIGIFAVVFLRWYRVQYVITTSEVYIKRGFISLDIAQIRLSRIQNTTLEQSMIERLLDYGDVVAYTAGTDMMNIEFKSVPQPSTVNRTLSSLLSQSKNEPVQV